MNRIEGIEDAEPLAQGPSRVQQIEARK